MVLNWFRSFLWEESKPPSLAARIDLVQTKRLEQERELQKKNANICLLNFNLTKLQSVNQQLQHLNLNLKKQIKDQEDELNLLQEKLENQTEQSEQVVYDAKHFYDSMLLSHKDVVNKLKEKSTKINELKHNKLILLSQIKTKDQVIFEYENCIRRTSQQMDDLHKENESVLALIEEERKSKKDIERSYSNEKIHLQENIQNLESKLKEFEKNNHILSSKALLENEELQTQLQIQKVDIESRERDIELKDEKIRDLMRDVDTLNNEINLKSQKLEVLECHLQEKKLIINNLRTDTASRGQDSENEELIFEQMKLKSGLEQEEEKLNRLVNKKTTPKCV